MSVIKGRPNTETGSRREVTTTSFGNKGALDVFIVTNVDFQISGVVDTFNDLPPAAGETDNIYQVKYNQGIFMINLKRAGLYRSTGTDWVRL